jgi:hypothetical protein
MAFGRPGNQPVCLENQGKMLFAGIIGLNQMPLPPRPVQKHKLKPGRLKGLFKP